MGMRSAESIEAKLGELEKKMFYESNSQNGFKLTLQL